jgi:uncharacterized protein (TIGR02271 family)
MPLLKLEDFYPNYYQGFSNSKTEIKHFDVYTGANEKVGPVADILVDDRDGFLRYIVVNTGFGILGRKVLLPVRLAQINYSEQQVVVRNLTKDQIQSLPSVDHLRRIDQDKGQVRSISHPMVYRNQRWKPNRPIAVNAVPAGQNGPYRSVDHGEPSQPSYPNSTQQLRLYEERLIADKHRHKTGEIVVGKHVETETAHVSMPIEKERVVIERLTPLNRTPINRSDRSFQTGEVMRMEIYEEIPDIRKEAFVREEVQVRKVVDQDLVDAEAQIRREELDLHTRTERTTEQ